MSKERQRGRAMGIEENKTDTNLKTFNTAKVYAEHILFPMMFDFKKFLRQANYGCHDLQEATSLSEEIRDIQRYNGLKAMSETCSDLLDAISSTVRLKGNAIENKKLKDTKECLQKVKTLFYENKHKFFESAYNGFGMSEALNRKQFEDVKNIVETCYINVEILMTKNKLLFADAKEDWQSDDEIKDAILREYVEG